MAFSSLEVEISSAFSGLDEDLYDAAIMDKFMLKDLVDRLASLNERVRSTHAFAKGLLKPRTISLIRSVSSRARILAKNMMNVHRTTDEITTKRGNEIAKVLARMSLKDSKTPTSSPDTLDTANLNEISTPAAAEDRAATFVNHATQSNLPSAFCVNGIQRSPLTLKTYEWLLANLHNPYPSPCKKSMLATNTGSSLKSVINSFDTVRRRIGWTKFTKKHFDGKNALAIDCAHRIFVSPDPKYPIPDLIRKDLLDVKMEVEKALQNQLASVKACETVEIVLKGVNIDSQSKPSSVGQTKSEKRSRKYKRCYSSEVGTTSQPVGLVEARPRSLVNTCDMKELPVPSGLHECSELASPGGPQKQRKRKSETQLNTEDNGQDQPNHLRPSKRTRPLSRSSSESSDASTSGPATPKSGSPLSPFIAITDSSWVSTPRSSRKRSHCDGGNDYTPDSKRRRNAYVTDSLSSEPTDMSMSDCGMSTGLPDTDKNTESTEISCDTIRNSLIGPDPNNSTSWNSLLFPGTVTGNDTGFAGMPVPCSSDWDTILGEGTPDLLSSYSIRTTPIEPSRNRIGDESSSVGLSGDGSTENSDVFGDDFADFPAMPDFNVDWTGIPPPSLNSFLLHPDFSFPSSLSMPMNCVPNDEVGLGSDSTLASPSAFLSALVDNASSRLSFFG